MNLTTLLDGFSPKNFVIPPHKVWLFTGSDYPLLFFSWFMKYHEVVGTLQSIDITTHDTLIRMLDMSFLGETRTYWLGDSSKLELVQRDLLFSYLTNYQGPHRVILFSSTKREFKDHLVIDMNEKVNKASYAILAQHLSADSRDTSFADELFKRVQELSIDQACLMVQYQKVVGRRFSEFFDYWFERIIIPERSLFGLSQQLFAKNKRLFLQQWYLIKDDYADEFWTVYWAEQVWQAYWFVILMQKNQLQEARAYARRLPFSFTQRDWRNYTAAELAGAHARLYHEDYLLKNGCSNGSLELFFFQFMQHYFKD